MGVCACGRTRGLSDRPLDSFGAVPLMIGSEIARFFIRIALPINIQGKGGPRRVRGFGAPGKLSGGQFSAENGRQPRTDRKAPGYAPQGFMRLYSFTAIHPVTAVQKAAHTSTDQSGTAFRWYRAGNVSISMCSRIASGRYPFPPLSTP